MNYFKSVADEAQFPAARCAMADNIFLYDHEASSGVESMNNSNKPARQVAAVDPTNSVLTVLEQESERYNKRKTEVWNWTTSLTPKGEKLCHQAFEVLVSTLYTYDVTDDDDHHEIDVRSIGGVCGAGGAGSIRTHTVRIPKEMVNGTRFGSCTCGVPQTKTIPCVHMVAIVQAKVITGLTKEVDVMPTWCSTNTWRLQYPQNLSMRGDLTIRKLKDSHQPNTKLRCSPKSAVGNKTGAPKKLKRIRGPIEKQRKKKPRMGVAMASMDGGEDEEEDFGEPDWFGGETGEDVSSGAAGNLKECGSI